mmetsp:Transcript_19610/g.62917  ORF Transcript_19610/g.62917 Transcript_19610/m.62917 type:complete len:204 (+) Transcript_19610:154-765(+)
MAATVVSRRAGIVRRRASILSAPVAAVAAAVATTVVAATHMITAAVPAAVPATVPSIEALTPAVVSPAIAAPMPNRALHLALRLLSTAHALRVIVAVHNLLGLLLLPACDPVLADLDAEHHHVVSLQPLLSAFAKPWQNVRLEREQIGQRRVVRLDETVSLLVVEHLNEASQARLRELGWIDLRLTRVRAAHSAAANACATTT